MEATNHFLKIPFDILTRTDLTAAAKLVYARLLDMDPDTDGLVRATFKWLAEDERNGVGLPWHVVRRAVLLLVKCGDLEAFPGQGKAWSAYRVTRRSVTQAQHKDGGVELLRRNTRVTQAQHKTPVCHSTSKNQTKNQRGEAAAPPTAPVTNLFEEEWSKHHDGRRFPWASQVEAASQTIRDEHHPDLETVQAAWRAYLEDRAEFLVGKGHPLNVFANQFAEWVERAAATTGETYRHEAYENCAGCGKWLPVKEMAYSACEYNCPECLDTAAAPIPFPSQVSKLKEAVG